MYFGVALVHISTYPCSWLSFTESLLFLILRFSWWSLQWSSSLLMFISNRQFPRFFSKVSLQNSTEQRKQGVSTGNSVFALLNSHFKKWKGLNEKRRNHIRFFNLLSLPFNSLNRKKKKKKNVFCFGLVGSMVVVPSSVSHRISIPSFLLTTCI